MNEKQVALSIKTFLLIISAYITSGIVVQFVRGGIPATVPVMKAEKRAATGMSQVRNLEHYALVWKENVFGSGGESVSREPAFSEIQKVEVMEETDKDKDLPLSSLNYKLMGTVAGPPSMSFAIIKAPGGKGQKLYRVGQEIEDAEIKAIRRNILILDNNGREEKLEIKFDEKVMSSRLSSSSVLPSGRGVTKVAANKFILDRKEVERLSGDVTQFMTQVRIVPNLVKGKASGYKMLNIKNGSLVASVGFRNGDILKEINGKSINRPEEAFQAYQQLKSGGGFTIEVERKGKRETIYYEVR
jgi:general secretion pathway protein C